jgi:membrane fusion protein (multidrug efflux system)
MSTTQETTPQPPAGNGAPNGSPPAAARNGKGKWRILLALLFLAVVAAGVSGYWYLFMRGIVYSDDARIAGHLVDLAPEINDRLTDVLVHEGEAIHKDQEMFRLDSSGQEAALAQVQASLASAQAALAVNQAQVDRAVNGNRPEEIKASEATANRLKNEEQLARLEAGRMNKLRADGAASQDEQDRAKTVLESARQSRENADQGLAVMRLGTRQEDVEAAKAALELARSKITEAKAAVEKVRADLTRCVVRAPFDGWVVRRWLDPGAMPLPGQPIVSVFDPSTLRVDANIEEKYLHSVHVGDRVDVSIDAYPGLPLQGKVTEILRATNSEFSLIPAEGVSGTFIKVTQRVPLRIAVTPPEGVRLGPGLSADVRIRIGSGTAAAAGGLASER